MILLLFMTFLLKSQKKILISSIFIIFLLSFFVLGVVRADQYGLDKTLGVDNSLKNALVRDDLPTQAGTLIGAVLAFVGVIFMALMIYGGFLWMMAQGNEQQVDKAKTLIVAAVIGLIIILSAYAITAYVGGKLGQTTTTGQQ